MSFTRDKTRQANVDEDELGKILSIPEMVHW